MVDRKSLELLYDALCAEIRYHKYRYYVCNDADITDTAYDMLEKRLDYVARQLGYEGSWVGCNDKEEG